MKKLLIMLSAAALATGAFADEEEVQTATLTSGTETFEGFDAGVNITTNTINTSEEYLWYSAGDAAEGETGAVTAYADGETKPANGADANANYLNVSTTTGTPLYRKLVAHDNQSGLNEDSDPVDIGTGIFVDTFVQFSGSETAPTIPDGSKLVVWVQAIDFDDNNTAEDPNDDIQGSTNLVVTAAMLDASGVPTATNFVIETAAGFNFEGWHRLTIRSIKEITSAGSKIAGFTVFVDDKQLAAKTIQIAGADAVIENDVEVTPAVPAVTYNDLMGAYNYDNNLTMEAKKFYTNRQLFVSLVRNNNANAQTLSAVGFDGTGKVDDVTVTDDPVEAEIDFAKGNYFFSVKWGGGVTEFTLTSGEWSETYTVTGEEENNTKVFDVPYVRGVTTLTLSNIEVASGTTLGTGAGEYDLTALYAEIETEQTQFTITVGDVTTAYSTFADAFDAAKGSGATIKLYKSLDAFNEDCELLEGESIVLDLNGKTMTTTASGHRFIVNGGSLTVISTEAQGAMTSTYSEDDYGKLIDCQAGTLVIGNNSDDMGVVFTGEVLGCDGAYVKGFFDIATNSNVDEETGEPIDEIYLPSFVAEGSTVAKDANEEYWVVTPGATPEPTLYAITVTAPANATAAITTNGVAYTDRVPTGTSYAVVVTPNEGYTYADVDLTGTDWVLDGDTIKLTGTVGDADVTIADVPAPAAAAKEIEAGTTKSFDDIEDAKAATNGVVITVSSTDAAAGITPDYFKPVITPNGNAFVVGVDLDETVIQPSADDAAETFIENLATAEVVDGIITIKFTGAQVKKGLKYGVAVSDSLTGQNSIQNATPETWETANDSGVDLKVTKPTNGKGFFKVHIKYEPSTPAE